MPRLHGQVIVVTGASSGIGRALAQRLATLQTRLVLAARDRARLEEVANAFRAAGGEVCVVPTDVTVESQCRDLIEHAVERFGRIDALVNNAGTALWARFDEVQDVSLYESVMRVNYLGGVYCTHHALEHLKASRGLIVAISSIAGLIGVPKLSAYSASKHAVVGFYESLRVELAASGVGVTIIAPDFVQSEILPRALDGQGRPLEISPLDQRKMLSSDECARRIVRAMARRTRLVTTSLRAAAGPWGRLVAPQIVDRIAASATRGR